MKAVIKTGGKQYYVSEVDFIYVVKLDGEAGDKVIFNEVLMCDNKVGNPYLNGASVEGEIVKNGKGKKRRLIFYSLGHASRHRKGLSYCRNPAKLRPDIPSLRL